MSHVFFVSRYSLKDSSLWYQQGGIAVAEEAEVVSEGVVVDLVPVALDEGADEKEQRGLGLVEVGYQHLYDLVVVAGGDDDLGATMQYLQTMSIHPDSQGLQCFNCACCITLGTVPL